MEWGEFNEAIKSLAGNMTEIESLALFEFIDDDNNHRVDIDEFVRQFAFEHVICLFMKAFFVLLQMKLSTSLSKLFLQNKIGHGNHIFRIHQSCLQNMIYFDQSAES